MSAGEHGTCDQSFKRPLSLPKAYHDRGGAYAADTCRLHSELLKLNRWRHLSLRVY